MLSEIKSSTEEKKKKQNKEVSLPNLWTDMIWLGIFIQDNYVNKNLWDPWKCPHKQEEEKY